MPLRSLPPVQPVPSEWVIHGHSERSRSEPPSLPVQTGLPPEVLILHPASVVPPQAIGHPAPHGAAQGLQGTAEGALAREGEGAVVFVGVNDLGWIVYEAYRWS